MIRKFNNISISNRNSFNIDVTARELIEFETVNDLHSIFTNEPLPYGWMVLSGGNNILFTKDVETTLLSPTSTEITIVEQNSEYTTIKVDGGAEWDDVVEWAVKRDLWGIENLSLIPGKAGAAPIQNIGAYGIEVCDALVSVSYFDTLTLTLKNLSASECRFAYRDSIFKHSPTENGLKEVAIVTAITLKLSHKAVPKLAYADVANRVAERGGESLRNIREVICEIRRTKLPDTKVMGNAGSFFKNPIVSREVAQKISLDHPDMPQYPIEGCDHSVKLAAGWLIEKCGMKGYREGNVGVHERQALVLVNHGGATGMEVMTLAQKVQSRVMEYFSVEISTEVNLL